MGKTEAWTNDLEIYKAIEANRRSIGETQKNIMLRALRNPAESDVQPRVRLSRKSGKYEIKIGEDHIPTHSLKMTLQKLIDSICKKDASFIEKLAQHRTPKGRRIVAKKPQELYPNNPDLAKTFGEELECGWWYDTNISRNQLTNYAKVICYLANLKYGRDVDIRFP